MIKVLIFDDNSIFRTAVVSRIDKCDEIEVLDEIKINHPITERTDEVQPDFILMGINVPTRNDTDAANFFREKYPSVPLVFISMHDDKEYTFSVLQPGTLSIILFRHNLRHNF